MCCLYGNFFYVIKLRRFSRNSAFKRSNYDTWYAPDEEFFWKSLTSRHHFPIWRILVFFCVGSPLTTDCFDCTLVSGVVTICPPQSCGFHWNNRMRSSEHIQLFSSLMKFEQSLHQSWWPVFMFKCFLKRLGIYLFTLTLYKLFKSAAYIEQSLKMSKSPLKRSFAFFYVYQELLTSVCPHDKIRRDTNDTLVMDFLQ